MVFTLLDIYESVLDKIPCTLDSNVQIFIQWVIDELLRTYRGPGNLMYAQCNYNTEHTEYILVQTKLFMFSCNKFIIYKIVKLIFYLLGVTVHEDENFCVDFIPNPASRYTFDQLWSGARCTNILVTPEKYYLVHENELNLDFKIDGAAYTKRCIAHIQEYLSNNIILIPESISFGQIEYTCYEVVQIIRNPHIIQPNIKEIYTTNTIRDLATMILTNYFILQIRYETDISSNKSEGLMNMMLLNNLFEAAIDHLYLYNPLLAKELGLHI